MNKNCQSYCRHLFAVLLVALSASSLHAKVIQPGKVRLQNSGSKPLAGVQISLRGGNHTISDEHGVFHVELPAAKEGDTISVMSVTNPGYEWVNAQEVKKWTASSTVPLDIVMCPAGQLAQNREKYMALAQSESKKVMEARIRDLDSLRMRDTVSWKHAKDSLEEQLTKYLKESQNLLDQLARTNFDDANDLQRRAFTLLQQGRIDSAEALLRSDSLSGSHELVSPTNRKAHP